MQDSISLDKITDEDGQSRLSQKSIDEVNSKFQATWFMPDYPPLRSRDDVGRAAVEGQVFEYPKIIRRMADPVIPAQQFGIVSFMFLPQPKIIKGEPVYGFYKNRGNHMSVPDAKFEAHELVRTIDSKDL